MPDETPASPELLRQILQEQLTATEDGLYELRKDRPQPSYSPKKPAPGERSSPAAKRTPEEEAAAEAIRALSNRMQNLQQVLGLFHRDPDLMRLVDTSIQKRMQGAEKKQAAIARAAQRRQTIFTVVLAVISLAAGWLLSAISPVSTVAHLVGR
jgi:hypothetical protein